MGLSLGLMLGVAIVGTLTEKALDKLDKRKNITLVRIITISIVTTTALSQSIKIIRGM